MAEIEKTEKKNKTNISRGVVLIILLLFIFTPTSVSYEVSEPTQVQVPLKYEVTNARQSERLSGFNWVRNGYVSVSNSDTEPGTFVVNCKFTALKRTLTDNDRVYVLPGETKTAQCLVDTDSGEDVEFTYTVDAGTKTVTETRTVTKQKNVRLYQKVLGVY